MISALEVAYGDVRSNHPDLPAELVFNTGTGRRGRSMTRGHFCADRWDLVRKDARIPEVFIAGELLSESGVVVFRTLLHEAAHALGSARGIKNCSSNQYHNKRFLDLAEELGMCAGAERIRGWSNVDLRPETVEKYAATIGNLDRVLSVFLSSASGPELGRQTNYVVARCGCPTPRRIRAAAGTLEAGPITCGICLVDFLPQAL